MPNTAIAKVKGQFGDLPFVSEWCPWLPPLFLMLGLVLALFFSVRRADGEGRATHSLTPMLLFVPPVVAGIIFAVYAGTDWMMFGRFIFPFWPLVVFPLS